MEEKEDIIFETNIKNQSEFRKRTPEESEKENEKTEQKTGLFRRFLRIIKNNPDLIVLTVIIVLSLFAGYYVSVIKMGLTTDQVKLQILDFFEFVGVITATLIAVIGKLYVKQGEISQSLSKSISKKSDISGRSISE